MPPRRRRRRRKTRREGGRRPKVIAPLSVRPPLSDGREKAAVATQRRRRKGRARTAEQRRRRRQNFPENNPRGRKEKERRGSGGAEGPFSYRLRTRGCQGGKGGRNCTRPLRRQKYEAERPAYRQGPLFLFPCRAGRAYESASLQPSPLSRPSWISLVSCATVPPNHLHCTGGTAIVVDRRKSAKGHRDTGNKLQSADHFSLTRSFGHHRVSGSKEPLALPRGKLTADFEEGAARAEDRQGRRSSPPPRRDQPRPGGGRSRRCARVKPGKTPSASREKEEGTRYTSTKNLAQGSIV